MKNIENLINETLRFMCCSKETEENIRSINRNSLNRYLNFKENDSKLSAEEFQKLYNENKEDMVFLSVLAKSEYCPSHIIDQIIYDNPEKLQTSILRNIINRKDLTTMQLQKICQEYRYDLDNIVARNYRQNGISYITKLVSEESLSKIIDTMMEIHGINDAGDLLKYSQDITLVKKYINMEYEKDVEGEHCLSVISSNKLLSDEIRNMAFDAGCPAEKIYEFTPYMVQCIYEQAMEAMDEINHSPSPNDMWMAKNMVYQVLENIVEKGLMTESMQIDYVNRIKELNPKAMDSILTKILQRTNSQTVLQIAKTLKSKDSINAYENPNMRVEDVQKKATDYCQKIIKARERKNNWPDVWTDYLRTYIPRVQLKEEHYLLLITLNKMKLNEEIAISPYTTISALEKLINNEQQKIAIATKDYQIKQYNKNIALAKINISFQKQSISPKLSNTAIEVFTQCENTFGTRDEPSEYERKFIERYKNKIGISQFEEVKNALANARVDLDKYSQSKINRLLYIEDYLVNEKKIYDGKSIETMSEYALKREKESLLKYISYNAREGVGILYDHILENLDKYNRINEILVERKKEKEEREVGFDER